MFGAASLTGEAEGHKNDITDQQDNQFVHNHHWMNVLINAYALLLSRNHVPSTPIAMSMPLGLVVMTLGLVAQSSSAIYTRCDGRNQQAHQEIS